MQPKFSVIITAYNQLPNFRDRILPALERQTERDFEVIVGDDGSSDGLGGFLRDVYVPTFRVQHVFQDDLGYGYTSIVNKSVERASGRYLVFLSGDTFPKDDFLEEIGRAVKPDRVVNGVRLKVDPSDLSHIGRDWRFRFLNTHQRFMVDQGVEVFPVDTGSLFPWVHMTMNTLAVSRKVWDAVGGLTPGYDGGYGKMDWSFCMKSHFSKYRLFWNVAAIGYELTDKNAGGRGDDPKNDLLFEQELQEWKHKTTL